jgi:hypothetical protein
MRINLVTLPLRTKAPLMPEETFVPDRPRSARPWLGILETHAEARQRRLIRVDEFV